MSEKGTRTNITVVEDGQSVKKKTANAERQPVKKKTSGGGKQPAGGKGVSEERRPVKKKTSDDELQPVKKKSSGGKQSAKKKSTAGGGQSAKRRQGEMESSVSKKKSSKSKKTGTSAKSKRTKEDDFDTHTSRRDKERARRKAARLRKVRRQKIIIGVLIGIIVAAAACIAVFCTPSVRLAFHLRRGDSLAAEAEYEGAQNAYEKALEIDAASVEAYRGMAGNYLAQEKTLEAEETYYKGWEQTKDEGLLHNYCVVLYNRAVADINAKNCSFSTVEICIQVLETEPENENALALMGTCYDRLFYASGEDVSTLFYDEDISQDTCGYTEYEQLLRKLLSLYQGHSSEQIKAILAQYALIDLPYVRISVPHLEQYMSLLTEINGIVNDAGITETLACLSRAKEIEDYFAAAFSEFEAGNYAYARELIAEESYQQIRDDFITENSGYWEGSVYIPVSREQLVLHNEDGQRKFFFLNEEDYNIHQGIIYVWGTKQEDDGVQRSVISYKPAGADGGVSDTEYTVEYLYSNVKIKGKYVPQMNYRFDTKTTTEEGVVTNAIGDWGGENEFEIDY